MTVCSKRKSRLDSSYKYPSNLNRIVSEFDGCCYSNLSGKSIEGDLKRSCALGDDRIYTRISSHLYKTLNGFDYNSDELSSFPLLPSDSCIVLPSVVPARNSLGSFLSQIGIEEVESLNPGTGGAAPGQCQFASVASALTHNYDVRISDNDKFRPDLELRKLTLYVIEKNINMYKHFLTKAGVRTRSKSSDGGSSVDCRAYLRSMSSPSCDGDAVTLQALCDALKITVRVVKTVDPNAYDEKILRQRLFLESSSVSIPSCISDDNISARTGLLGSEDRNISSSKMPSGAWKRVFVSSELRPRPLYSVDSRIKDVQKIVRGRLIWLSHIGDEAHYRFLRPMGINVSDLQNCNTGSKGETKFALLSRKVRLRKLKNCCSLDDNYVNERRRIRSQNKFHCGLCFEEFSEDCNVLSPSSCHHNFCRKCILLWALKVSKTCPICSSVFNELFFHSSSQTLSLVDICPNESEIVTTIDCAASLVSTDDDLSIDDDKERCNNDTFTEDVDNDSLTFVKADYELDNISFSLSHIHSSVLEHLHVLFSSIEGEVGNILRRLLLCSVKFIPDISCCFVSKYDHIPFPCLTEFEIELERDLIPVLSSIFYSEDVSAVENLLKFGLLSFFRILLTLSLSDPLKYKVLGFIHTVNMRCCQLSCNILSLDLLRQSLGLSKVILSILISSQPGNDFGNLARKILLHWSQAYSEDDNVTKSTSLLATSVCNFESKTPDGKKRKLLSGSRSKNRV